MNQFNQAKKRHLEKEPESVFVEVPLPSDTSHPVRSGKHSFQDNRPMLYFQGMKR